MSAIAFDIEGLEQAARDLEALADRLNARRSDLAVKWVFGGPAAPYALYVHEDMEAWHDNGQARFLAHPLEESAPSMAARIARDVDAGMSFAQAILALAEIEMTEMKAITPVRYGPLHDSGHVLDADGREV